MFPLKIKHIHVPLIPSKTLLNINFSTVLLNLRQKTTKISNEKGSGNKILKARSRIKVAMNTADPRKQNPNQKTEKQLVSYYIHKKFKN